MKFIKPVLWTALGVVIGVTAVLTTSRIQAQQKRLPDRIEVTPATEMNVYGVFFVKDNKSAGCWIAIKENSNLTALAVAPASACN